MTTLKVLDKAGKGEQNVAVVERGHQVKNKQEVIQECRKELAMNFETPAERILAFWGSQIGLTAKEMVREMRKAEKS